MDLEEHLKRIREKRWQNASPEEKFAVGQRMSRAYWDSLSPEQRSQINKARAAKRKRRAKIEEDAVLVAAAFDSSKCPRCGLPISLNGLERRKDDQAQILRDKLKTHLTTRCGNRPR